ncbi:MAG TPA: UDP-N-acetylmuramate--L-alanine ligase [Vicinamibacterales bacterium]|nr:UDP-N-acetylmuramate--L-alanine ligase [Vicinamibacterales bacterium]
MLGKTHRIHFVGVGGIGMSGIAELLANLGYRVSGSDARASEATERLASLGVEIVIGHKPENVGDVDVVVFTSAVRPDNPELMAACTRRIPVIPRAELLGELMRLRFGIAVAGAHGKTSTTSMIALVLERAGLDPTAVIGGRLSAFGSNARLGRGAYMVAEADESDRSFLKLYPSIAVMTNIDHEHMEAYGGFEDLVQAFADFANRVPFYGSVIVCGDDPELMQLRPRLTRRVVTYGLTRDHVDVTAVDVRLDGFGSTCTVVRRHPPDGTGETLGPLSLQVPGRHSVQNALAAVAVGLELDVPFDHIATALSEFQGVERRFQHFGAVNGIRVVDDYGHHPTEIAAVLAAARAAQPSRVIVAFQAHRYSRTRDLMREFGLALAGADELILTDIYAASEDPLPGVTVEALAASVNTSRANPATVVRSVDDLPAALAAIARPGDLVVTMGAGSIGSVAARFVAELERRHGQEAT